MGPDIINSLRRHLSDWLDSGLLDIKMETKERPEGPQNKNELSALEELRELLSHCQSCALGNQKIETALNVNSQCLSGLFVVVDSPQKPEGSDYVFSSAVRELVIKMLQAIGVSFNDVYVTSVIKCITNQGMSATDKASALKVCQEYLKLEAALLKPRLVLLWGELAAQSVLQTGQNLEELRGVWHDWDGIPVRVSYHPAALLRDSSLKKMAWKDMQEIEKSLKA